MTLVVTSLFTLATEANAAHAAAEAAALTTLQCWRRAGDALRAAKDHVSRGGWLPWLTEHCPNIPERTARAYMRVSRRWPELQERMDRQGLADLPVQVALAWLAEPKVQSDEFPEVKITTEYRCPRPGCEYEWSGKQNVEILLVRYTCPNPECRCVWTGEPKPPIGSVE